MMDASSTTQTAEPARLLLVGSQRAPASGLALPFTAEFAVAPEVVELGGGRQAIELLRSSDFDLIAADLDALGDLGDKLDDRIGRLARAATGTLLLVLCDDASISVAMAAMRAGAHDCVSKTCAPGALVRRLSELARRYGKAHLLAEPTTAVGPADAVSGSAGPSIPVMRDLVLPMWRQEQKIIEDAIQSFAGNIALAAAALELSPSTIYRKRQSWAGMDGRRD